MKLTTLFLIVSLFQTQATTSVSEDVKITISFQNVSLEKVLNRIETLTEYKFVYKDQDVEYKKRISINVDKKPLSKVLNQLFSGTTIKYSVSDKHIVLKPKPVSKEKQIDKPKPVVQTKFQVSGTVIDASGMPLPGANVIEKGTTNGATADFDGNYTIKVANKNATLEISYLGYVTQDIPINGQSNLNITLQEDLAQLEEVVVVGYGTQKKESVVGSITQAKGEELLQAGNVGTVSEALTGIMPGVSTLQAAGQPGSTQANILIRGQSTFGDNSPLTIVDGVERDFNDIDPNEIESISVLKDASATAVFGVRAANGVIVVTTKRGQIGEAKVNFTATWGYKKPTMDTNYYADYATTLERFNEAAINSREYDRLVPQSEIDTWRDPNRDKRFYTYTTWINELIDSGTNSQYNLNISGGTKFVRYFTSVGYQFDGGIFNVNKQPDFDPRTYQKRYNWRTNLDFNFSKTTKFAVNLAGNFKKWNGNLATQGTNNGVVAGSGSDFARFWQVPMIGPQPQLEDGRLTTEEAVVLNPNFLRIERAGQWQRRSNQLFTDFNLTQNITKDLKIGAKVSYNFGQNYENSLQQSLIYHFPTEIDGEKTFIQEGDPNAVQQPLRRSGESIDGSSNRLYYELRANYNKTIAKNHDVGLLALFNRTKSQSGAGFPRYEESWVGRATYAYKSKYLTEFNAAYNGSENWAPGLRYGFFPSLAVGWVVSKENFFEKNVGFMNFLKFRYSYGEVGNDRLPRINGVVPRFLYQSSFISRGGGNSNFFYGDPLINYGPVYYEGRPAVRDNTWETGVKQDLGIEMGFFKNKLRSTIEFFDERRSGILLQRRTVAPWFGNERPFANIGKTKNHGVDIELRWNDKIGEDFSYSLRGNMSLSESRIIERDDPSETPPQQRDAGKPIGWQNGFINDGIYQSWDELYNSTASSFDAANALTPGSFSFVDYNGDGIINEFDRVPIKNPNFASKTYAFNINLEYKNFGLRAVFNGMFDISKELSNTFLWEYNSRGSAGFHIINNEQLDAWSVNNPNGTHPALKTSSNNHDSQRSTHTIRTSDFLRFRTLELKYKFGKKLKETIGLFDNFEIYVNGNNLVTWTNLPSAFDPEQRRLEVYPLTKRYNLGVRLSF